MKAWEHKLTTISIYSAVYSYTAKNIDATTIKYFSAGFLLAFIGSFFPDYDIKIFGPGTSPDGFINVKGHRGLLHYYKFYVFVFIPLILALFIARIFYNFDHMFSLIIFSISCFFFGNIMHILEDSITTVGIPIYRFNKELYKSYSYKIGNFDSIMVSLVAIFIFIGSALFIAYNVLNKFL